MFASHWLLLESASERHRLFLLFLSLVDLLHVHDLQRRLIDLLDIFTNHWWVFEVPTRGHFNLFLSLYRSDLICILPFHGLLSAHLCVTQVLGVMISLGEVGR